MSRVMTNFSMPVLTPGNVGSHEADCKHCGKSILTLIAKKGIGELNRNWAKGIGIEFGILKQKLKRNWNWNWNYDFWLKKELELELELKPSSKKGIRIGIGINSKKLSQVWSWTNTRSGKHSAI